MFVRYEVCEDQLGQSPRPFAEANDQSNKNRTPGQSADEIRERSTNKDKANTEQSRLSQKR